ncbi:hypothetical protein KCU93_g3451, partial [Aureobasidium melanogenum]
MSTKRPPTPSAKPPALRRKRVAPPSDDEDDYIPVSDHNISGDETPVQQRRRSSRRNAAKDVSKEDEGSVRPSSSRQARSAKKMPGVSNKRVKVSSAITTASNRVDDATNHDYPNVQKHNDLIDECGMMLRPDAVSMWTPTAGRLPHVTELEPVDGRSWEGYGGLKGCPRQVVTFTELTALFNIDTRTLGQPFRPTTAETRGAYGEMMSIDFNKEGILQTKSPGKLFWEIGPAIINATSSLKERVNINVDPKQVDHKLVEKIDVPEMFSFALQR